MRRYSAITAVILVLTGLPAFGDSLFKASSAGTGRQTLIAKSMRFQPGDIVTVVVKETIESSVSANTNTKKESDVESQAEAGSNEFLVADKPNGLGILNKEQLPNYQIGAKNEHKTTGQTRRTSELNTSVSCVVMQVLNNGLLMLEGEKVVSVNREDSRLKISGLARVRDVTAANTIDSTQLANASIILSGKGPLWNNQRRGLVTRLLDWVSPF